MNNRFGSFFHILHDTHSCLEWKACSPGKQVGAGQAHERQAGTIGTTADELNFGWVGKPARWRASRALAHYLRMAAQHLAHVAVLFGFSLPRDCWGRLSAPSTMRCSTLAWRFKSRFREIAQDEFDGSFFNIPFKMNVGWIKPCIPSVCSGLSLSGNFATIRAAIFSAFSILPLAKPGCADIPWMVTTAPSALKVSFSMTSGGFSVNGIAKLRAEFFHIHLVHAAADFFVGRKQDSDFAVFEVLVVNQDMRASIMAASPALLSAPSKRGAAGGDDVVANLVFQVFMFAFANHHRRVVGQHQILAFVIGMHDRFHAFAGAVGRGVHVGAKTNDGHFFVAVGWNSGVHIAVFIEVRVADVLGQLGLSGSLCVSMVT
jgi:hypothetical protein